MRLINICLWIRSHVDDMTPDISISVLNVEYTLTNVELSRVEL